MTLAAIMLILSGHDGDDAKPDQEKAVRDLLRQTAEARRRMPSRKLCNDVQREVAKLGLDRVSGLFCYVPLHNFRDGIDLLELFGVKTERSYSASLRN